MRHKTKTEFQIYKQFRLILRMIYVELLIAVEVKNILFLPDNNDFIYKPSYRLRFEALRF